MSTNMQNSFGSNISGHRVNKKTSVKRGFPGFLNLEPRKFENLETKSLTPVSSGVQSAQRSPTTTSTFNNSSFYSVEENSTPTVFNNDCSQSSFQSNVSFSIPKSPYQVSSMHFRATLVHPNIYLGSECDAWYIQNLHQHGIKFLLNVALEVNFSDEVCRDNSIRKKKILLRDSSLEHNVNRMKKSFDEAFAYIDEAIASNTKILVYCGKGVSRSATIVIAWFMKHYASQLSTEEKKGIDLYKKVLDEIYKLRWEKSRIEVGPNFGFCMLLEEFSKSLAQ